MTKKNKISSTDKSNSDKSEVEPQTEAQRVTLKANQYQELRSIEMEIRELEKEMRQKQIIHAKKIGRKHIFQKEF